MTWYVGAPCYIIPDAEWNDFCEAIFAEENQKRAEHYEHIDSVIEWRGQTLTIWSNGGDGEWAFGPGVSSVSLNDEQSFGVDAGIFCAIDLDKLEGHYEGTPASMGIIFAGEPDLYVEDGVVYLNKQHDANYHECDNCGEVVLDSWYDDEEDHMVCDNCW